MPRVTFFRWVLSASVDPQNKELNSEEPQLQEEWSRWWKRHGSRFTRIHRVIHPGWVSAVDICACSLCGPWLQSQELMPSGAGGRKDKLVIRLYAINGRFYCMLGILYSIVHDKV